MSEYEQREFMTPMQKVEVLRAACCVAGIEGNIQECELPLLQKIAKEVGVGKASLDAMMDRAKSDPEFHNEQFQILKSEPQKCMATILQVAMCDGEVTEAEAAVLKALSQKLNVADDVFNEIMSSISGMMD